MCGRAEEDDQIQPRSLDLQVTGNRHTLCLSTNTTARSAGRSRSCAALTSRALRQTARNAELPPRRSSRLSTYAPCVQRIAPPGNATNAAPTHRTFVVPVARTVPRSRGPRLRARNPRCRLPPNATVVPGCWDIEFSPELVRRHHPQATESWLAGLSLSGGSRNEPAAIEL